MCPTPLRHQGAPCCLRAGYQSGSAWFFLDPRGSWHLQPAAKHTHHQCCSKERVNGLATLLWYLTLPLRGAFIYNKGSCIPVGLCPSSHCAGTGWGAHWFVTWLCRTLIPLVQILAQDRPRDQRIRVSHRVDLNPGDHGETQVQWGSSMVRSPHSRGGARPPTTLPVPPPARVRGKVWGRFFREHGEGWNFLGKRHWNQRHWGVQQHPLA